MVKKQRGRRGESRKKTEDEIESTEDQPVFFEDVGGVNHEDQADVPDELPDVEMEGAPGDNEGNFNEPTFFGLVDRQELEYFKTAESTLAVDGFASSEERQGFIDGVFEEAKGKELKLVINQVCSKLIERLILLASDEQAIGIFSRFSGHILSLSKHKYSSHCVETLLVRSAALVEKEILNQLQVEDGEKPIHELLVSAAREFEPVLKEAARDPYASHVLRVLLLILNGSELPSASSNSSALRSKKSRSVRKYIDIKGEQPARAYQVPGSFKEELKTLISSLASDLDTTSSREMAIDKVSSPVMQLVIQIESSLGSKKKRKDNQKVTSLIFTSNSPDSGVEDSSEGAFVEYLLSDPVGSHFFEAVIQWLSLGTVERLYTTYMKDRIEKLARRDAGSFVVQAVLKKLRPNEARAILDTLIPDLEILSTSNSQFVRTLIRVSANHENYRQDEIVNKILDQYKVESPLQFASKLLSLDKLDDTAANSNDDMNRSLLFQDLVDSSPKCLANAAKSFEQLDTDKLIAIAKHPQWSHCLEKCFVPKLDIVIRRKLLNKLSGSFAELACNAYGSHLIDACWKFTYKLKFFRERIAQELVDNEQKVKHDSMYGRTVWRNWKLDDYVRRKHEWWKAVKEEEDVIAQAFGLENAKDKTNGPNKVDHRHQKDSAHAFKGPRGSKGPSHGKDLSSHRQKPYDRPKKTNVKH